MGIDIFDYTDDGMKRVYDNGEWIVGIKNWRPNSDIMGFDCFERHNLTDELFALVRGRCVLIWAVEEQGELSFNAAGMEAGKVYNIPKSLWHNAIMSKNTGMIVVEASSTSTENSDVLKLEASNIDNIRIMVEQHM